MAFTESVDCVVAGHCGVPCVRHVPTGRGINPGVIAMPPQDGQVETSNGRLDGGTYAPHGLSYDWRGAQRAMRAAGLGYGYDTELEIGNWASEDGFVPPYDKLVIHN